MRTHRTNAAVAAAAAALLLGACADNGGDGGAPGETSPPASPPMPTAEHETVTGQLAEGVEAGCVILRTETEEYLLVTEEELPDSGRATVRGYPDPSLPTLCQQGVPFIVEEVMAP